MRSSGSKGQGNHGSPGEDQGGAARGDESLPLPPPPPPPFKGNGIPHPGEPAIGRQEYTSYRAELSSKDTLAVQRGEADRRGREEWASAAAADDSVQWAVPGQKWEQEDPHWQQPQWEHEARLSQVQDVGADPAGQHPAAHPGAQGHVEAKQSLGRTGPWAWDLQSVTGRVWNFCCSLNLQPPTPALLQFL